MKSLIKKLLRESLISEEENKYIIVGISEDGYDEQIEEYGLNTDELSNRAYQIANENGIRIYNNKRLSSVLVDIENRLAIGGVWTSDGDEFSFDIALDKNYQNLRLSHLLIDAAISEYQYQNDIFMDMNRKRLPINVEVINPKLADILKRKYGFKINKKQLSNNGVIMTKKIGESINSDDSNRFNIQDEINVITNKYKTIGLLAFVHLIGSYGIEISSIKIVDKTKRKQGLGSAFMTEIMNLCDKYKLLCALTPLATETPKKHLLAFYKKFDFVSNLGKVKDFRFRNTMIRYPK